MAAEEIQQSIGLRAAGSEMHVGDEQSAEAPIGGLITQGVTSHARALTDSHDRSMTVRAPIASMRIIARPRESRIAARCDKQATQDSPLIELTDVLLEEIVNGVEFQRLENATQ
jgi:hypothetical protein